LALLVFNRVPECGCGGGDSSCALRRWTPTAHDIVDQTGRDEVFPTLGDW
jgi:hypothetical protein